MKNKQERRYCYAAPLFFALAVSPAGLFAGGADALAALDGAFPGGAAAVSGVVTEVLPAQAVQPGVFDVQPEKFFYVLPWQAIISPIGPPPADGSPADLEDLSALRRWQAERTEAQCRAANAQADAGFDAFFGEVSPFGVPAPAEVDGIFRKVRSDASSSSFLLKKRYRRPRPYERDASITPCVEKEASFAYPSGHASASRIFALILARLVPADADKFIVYADRAALNRVIGGVHHPADIEAGKQLGDSIFKVLKRDRAFKKDLEILRGYLKR